MPASAANSPEQLRTVGRRARYDEDHVDRLVRQDGRISFLEGLAALRLHPDSETPLAVLVRLFLGGETLDRPLVDRVLDANALDDVLTVQGRTVRARFRIEPFRDLLVASDWQRRIRPGHVLGVGRGTRILADLTVRRRVGSALDLCTGSGALALLAARHAEQVVAVDLNPRALRLARVNAALNGVRTVDWRRGNLYEPVGDERFDLIVANPPFVVSPTTEFLFRDGGSEGDDLSHAVVDGAAARLRDGGYALVICGWVAPTRGVATKPLRAWVRGSGCDALLLTYHVDSPSAYALQWNLRPGRTLEAATTEAEEWVAHYRSRGIERIATGIVILRRRAGRNWVREDSMPRMPIGAAGAHVERIFAAQDMLRSLRDEREVLALPLVPAPETMLVERRRPSGEVERARLSVVQGIPLAGHVPAACVPVIPALDGARSVAEAADAVGVSADKCLAPLRDLVARGLLVAGPQPPNLR